MYDAFISYSRVKDTAIAAGLQSVIQTLGQPWWRIRTSRVFLDDRSLAAAPGLRSALEGALGASRYLIMLASPQSAASKWVQQEAHTWLDSKGSDNLLIALTEGELLWDEQTQDFRWGPDTPLPTVMRGRLKSEPLWVDLRPFRAEGQNLRRSNHAFLAAGAALAAPIRGVARDDLLSEEAAQQRRNMWWAWGAAAVLALFLVVAVWQAFEATWARDIAVAQRDRAQRVLDQIIASANGRVIALAERTQQASQAQDEIGKIAAPGAAPAADLARATELLELSARYFENVDFPAALKAAETALPLLGTADGTSQAEPSLRLARAKAHERIGLTQARLGRSADAARHLAISLQLFEGLATETPDDAELRDLLAKALVNAGDICRDIKTCQDAERDFRRAIALRATAAALPGSSIEARRLLAVAHYRLANLQHAQSQYDVALETAKLSMSMLEQLRAEAPDNRPLQRDLAVVYGLQADTLNAAGKADLAITWHQKELATSKPLVDSDPGNVLWQHDLATTLDKLGRVLEALGRNDAALEAYAQAIAIGDMLKAQSRPRPEWLRDTAATLVLRGTLLTRLGRPGEGVLAFRRGLAMREHLASTDARWQLELEDGYRRAREALLKSNYPAEALETAEQLLFATSLAADNESGKGERVARVLSSLCWTALLAQNTQRAVWAGQQALVLAPDLRSAKLNYAHALMYAGDLAGAKKIYLQGLSAGGNVADDWRKAIRKDFADLSERRLRHPFMAEIDREIGK